MEELAKAMAEAVRTGAPIAKTVFGWYALRDVLGYILTSVTIISVAYIIGSTIRRTVMNWQRIYEDESKRKYPGKP